MRKEYEQQPDCNLFRQMFDNHSAIMLVIDPSEGLIRMANRAAEEFYGYPHDKLTSLTIYEINCLPVDEIKELMLQATTGNRNSFQFPHRLASGELRIVEVHSSRMMIEDQDLLFSIIHDVSHRVAVEKALLESELRFRSLFEYSIDAILLTVPDGRTLAANASACAMFKRTEEELMSLGRVGIVDVSDTRAPYRLAKRLQNGYLRSEELNMVRGDGEIFPAEVSSSIFSDSDGQSLAYMIIRDVSERKKYEAQLVRERTMLKEAVKITMLGTWEWDLVEATYHFSEEWLSIHGVKKKKLDMQELMKLAHPDDLQMIHRAIDNALNGTGKYELEHRIIRWDDGVTRHIRASGEVIRNSDGRPVRIYGVTQDITERKLGEAELENHRNKLAMLAAELSITEERERKRIAVELHDHIGQALTLCRFKLEQLEKEIGPQHRAAAFEISNLLLTSIASLRSLTTQLSPPMLYLIGLDSALQWLCRWLRGNYSLEVSFSRISDPVKIKEDVRSTLFQCCRELLLNVAKHAGVPEAVLTIDYRKERVKISISDEGNGFSVHETLNKTDLHGGYGLFNVCRRIEYLNGHCTINSSPGNGTCITISVPIDATEDSPALTGSPDLCADRDMRMINETEGADQS